MREQKRVQRGVISAGHWLVAAAAAGWGCWSLAFRTAEGMGPLSSHAEALCVLAMTSAVTLPQALMARGNTQGRSSRAWLWLIALGVSNAINNVLYFAAMRMTTVAIAVLTHSMAPLLVALTSPMLTGEKPSSRTRMAVLGALIGLTLLLSPWNTPAEGMVAGSLAGLGSALCYTFNVIVQKRLSTTFTPHEIVAYHAVVACALLALVAPHGALVIAPAQLGVILPAAVLLGGIASLAFVRGLAVIPASHAATLALLEPTVAVLIGALVWGEPLGPQGALGGVLVLGSLASAVTRSSEAP